MKPNYSVLRFTKDHLHQFADLLALNFAHLVLWLLDIYAPIDQNWVWGMVLTSNILGVVISFGSQLNNRSWGYGRHLSASLRFAGIYLIVGSVINLLFFHGKYTFILTAHSSAALFLSAFGRIGLTKFLHVIRKRGFNYRRVIIVGSEDLTENFASEIQKKAHYGYRLLASFTEDLEYSGNASKSGKPNGDIYNFLVDANIDEVFVSVQVKPEKVQSLFTFCQLNGIVIHITHDFLNGLKLEPMNIRVDTSGIAPTLTIDEDWYAQMMRTDIKRLFDVVVSLAFLIGIASWLFPLIALLIRVDSRGPVFFKQKRTGLNHREFLCYKFRTMYVNSESDTRQATKYDNRITPFGRLMRATNLDELPQFINVLLGDMSIVGPRPHMIKHTTEYSQMLDSYNERLWIKPGITGLSQSLGFRGEIREFQQLVNRIHNDRKYIRNWSLLLDVKIILSTAWNMLSFQRTGV